MNDKTKTMMYKILACIFLLSFVVGLRSSDISQSTWQFWALLVGGVGQAVLVNFKPKEKEQDEGEKYE